MQPDSNRNTIIFVVCAVALFIAYQVLVLEPAAKRREAEAARQAPAAAAAVAPGQAPNLNAPAVPTPV
ncbi:MAG: preprotein translocase subunit, partial [Caulobacteraceae bacterium]|nr:preprotein translocase subunit [Caulobacteraceae bacterium]